MPSNKTFSSLYTNVGNEVKDTSSAFQTIIKNYINKRYRDVLLRLISVNLFEAYRTITVTTTAGTRNYTMPYDFGEVVYAMDTSNDRSLDIINEQELTQRFGSNLTQQSTPITLISIADSTVRVQPASASTLQVVSSNSADTTQSIFMRGISGSAEFYETVNLSGNTAKTSSNTYDYILQLTKSASTTGQITITYVTGGDTASIIAPESVDQRYKRIGFHYVPNGNYAVDIRYKRDIKPMVADNDTPIIDIADGVEMGAIADAWRYKRQFANATDSENRYELWLDRYINIRNLNQPHQFDVVPYPRGDTY